VVAAAVLAGSLGVLASLRVDHPWLARTAPVQDALRQPRAGQVPAVPVAREGDPVPALRLPDPSGTPLLLAGLIAGRPALVNVWASWCGPCVKEMPLLDAFDREQGPNGVQVVGIALDEPAAVRAFLARTPVAYPILVDAAGPADAGVRLGNPRGVLPYSVLVGADGHIVEQWVGPVERADLQRWARRVGAPPTRN
jgi:thiol-disulfide isomerase/thioredoxin